MNFDRSMRSRNLIASDNNGTQRRFYIKVILSILLFYMNFAVGFKPFHRCTIFPLGYSDDIGYLWDVIPLDITKVTI